MWEGRDIRENSEFAVALMRVDHHCIAAKLGPTEIAGNDRGHRTGL